MVPDARGCPPANQSQCHRGVDAGDLAKLLTVLIRGERFCDGTLAQAFESGLLGRILDRIALLAGIDPTRPVTLPKEWHRVVVHPGVDPRASGLCEWQVVNFGIHVGEITRWRRPFREYAPNVERRTSSGFWPVGPTAAPTRSASGASIAFSRKASAPAARSSCIGSGALPAPSWPYGSLRGSGNGER
nr:DUF6508 domain-containing protein [Aureimonas sp. AU4]